MYIKPLFRQPCPALRLQASRTGRSRSVGLHFIFFAASLLGFLFTSPPCLAQQGGGLPALSAEDRARLEQFERSLDFLRQQYRIPGLSAAIVNNQRIVWERGFGFQDRENAVPATPDTPYRTASLTKTFSSMLLMKCVEEGRLDLNERISNYTSMITQAGVTVRHVFTHTSESQPPGESFRYNGNRFVALTPVVDACMGVQYRLALARNILDRLEMWDSVPGHDIEDPSGAASFLFDQPTLERYRAVIARLAKPYAVDSRGQVVLSSYPNRGISASAGLISTVRDLAKYDAAIDGHLLLTQATQEQAWTNHMNSRGQSLPYALGWFVQRYAGERLIWHYGYWPTFSALYLKVPGRNVTLILLANSDGLSAPFNSLGAGDVTGSAFASLFLQMLSDPAAFARNPIDDQREFVRQHYLDFLNREPDAPGLEFWTGNITRCGADAACVDRQRTTTSAAFFLSPEFQYTGYFVYRMYKGSLPAENGSGGGRNPTYLEFMRDVREVARGIIVDDRLSGTVIEENKRRFAAAFTERAEFKTIYDALSNQDYVERLFQTTGTNASAGDKQSLVEGLNNGTETRASVLQKIVDGVIVAAEGNQQFTTHYGRAFYEREFNNAFVLMEYFGYMRRDPDAPGYSHWLGKLNFYGNYLDAEMVRSFIVSPEYRARFGRP